MLLNGSESEIPLIRKQGFFKAQFVKQEHNDLVKCSRFP